MSAITSGDIQVGMAGVTGPIQAISRGLPIVTISDLHPGDDCPLSGHDPLLGQ